MRWPWQPRPGFVRVKARDLVETYAGALRANELERENAALTVRANQMAAQLRAGELLAALPRFAGEQWLLVSDLSGGLPLTVDGRLHEDAFTAWADAAAWQRRDRALAVALELHEQGGLA